MTKTNTDVLLRHAIRCRRQAVLSTLICVVTHIGTWSMRTSFRVTQQHSYECSSILVLEFSVNFMFCCFCCSQFHNSQHAKSHVTLTDLLSLKAVMIMMSLECFIVLLQAIHRCRYVSSTYAFCTFNFGKTQLQDPVSFLQIRGGSRCLCPVVLKWCAIPMATYPITQLGWGSQYVIIDLRNPP